MGKKQKDWARRARSLLMWLLGDACATCGSTKNLEFDCIKPQGDAHHKYDTSHRMSFYRQQYDKGNLQIQCAKCHNKKTAKDEQLRLDNEPF